MLVDVKTEFCEVFAKKQYSVLQTLLLKNLGPYSNLNQPCPWNPGPYYVKDFNFGMRHWPSIVPEGRYIMNVTGTGPSNNFLANFQLYFQVMNYGILDLRVG